MSRRWYRSSGRLPTWSDQSEGRLERVQKRPQLDIISHVFWRAILGITFCGTTGTCSAPQRVSSPPAPQPLARRRCHFTRRTSMRAATTPRRPRRSPARGRRTAKDDAFDGRATRGRRSPIRDARARRDTSCQWRCCCCQGERRTRAARRAQRSRRRRGREPPGESERRGFATPPDRRRRGSQRRDRRDTTTHRRGRPPGLRGVHGRRRGGGRQGPGQTARRARGPSGQGLELRVCLREAARGHGRGQGQG